MLEILKRKLINLNVKFTIFMIVILALPCRQCISIFKQMGFARFDLLPLNPALSQMFEIKLNVTL